MAPRKKKSDSKPEITDAIQDPLTAPFPEVNPLHQELDKTFQGLPWHGPKQMMEKGAPKDQRPNLKTDAHVAILRTSRPEDLKILESILQKQADGHVDITMAERKFIDAKEEWMIFVTYKERYFVAGKQATLIQG